MASSPFPFAANVDHHRHRHAEPPNYNSSAITTINPTNSFLSSLSKINLHRSFPSKRNSSLVRGHGTTSPSEPPSDKHTHPSSGVTPKDTLQIFFAVLFWMSLFFWSCAWDGGNSGRPSKGSRYRK